MTRLEKTILNNISEANRQWDIFSPNDKVLVAVSGGKDSLALLHLLKQLPLEIKAVHISLSGEATPRFITENKLQDEIEVISSNILQESHQIESRINPCFICSRLRRKKIIEYAKNKGYKKIALGHHRNDVTETLLLNMIYSREISTMTPKQQLFNGDYEIIRPMYLVDEKLLVTLCKENHWKTYPPACEEDKISKRTYIRTLLEQISKGHPNINVTDNIYSSLKQIKASFLPYPILFD